MHAKPGDWLIVETADADQPARRARIEEVGASDGAPPFSVRWLDTGHEGLVFPGSDAYVLTQDELDEQDARMRAGSGNGGDGRGAAVTCSAAEPAAAAGPELARA